MLLLGVNSYRRFKVVARFLTSTTLSLALTSQLVLAEQDHDPMVFDDQYIIEPTFAAANGRSTLIASALASHGAKVRDELGRGTILVGPNFAKATVGERDEIVPYSKKHANFCAKLVKSRAVKSCEPNFIVKTSVVPNDASYGSLWGMNGANGISAPAAWDISTGNGDVVVAVIDTGIDYNHPDLAANIWVNTGEIPGNSIDDDNNGYVDDVHGINAITNSGNPLDDNGHGTHVAGTIGAVGNNATGVVGVNWNVKIMGLKFLSANGSGSLANAIKAINYMVLMKNRGVNVRVSNNSWGGGGFSQSLSNAIAQAQEAGIIFVAAAGNEGNDNDARPSYPAGYEHPNVISVAAIDSSGNLAWFSNYGSTSVDIGAPGVGILSTVPAGGYQVLSGTSMATPHVAGALALLASYDGTLTNSQLISRLYDSGVSLPTLTGIVRTGRTLNAARMLANLTNPLPPSAPQQRCQYSASQVSLPADTSADNAPIIIQQDELGFHTIPLPFSFPFYGVNKSAMTVSPNGVIYLNGAPGVMDYNNGPTAPLNSIAVLHTDLNPNRGGGVRARVDTDSLTVTWKAEHYMVSNGFTEIRVRLDRYGIITAWYSFTTPTIENYIASRSTVGIRGETHGSAYTYAYNDSKITNGKAIRFIPNCSDDGSISVLELKGLNGAKFTRPGENITVSMFGDDGIHYLTFKFGGMACPAIGVTISEGVAVFQGPLPRRFNSVPAIAALANGGQRRARITIRAAAASKRHSRG